MALYPNHTIINNVTYYTKYPYYAEKINFYIKNYCFKYKIQLAIIKKENEFLPNLLLGVKKDKYNYNEFHAIFPKKVLIQQKPNILKFVLVETDVEAIVTKDEIKLLPYFYGYGWNGIWYKSINQSGPIKLK